MEVLLEPWVYIYGAQKNCLIETVHFSTYNTCYTRKHLKCIYRFFCVSKIYALQWYYSISGIRVNIYKNCKHGSHIYNHGFIFLDAQKNRLIDTALLNLILFCISKI